MKKIIGYSSNLYTDFNDDDDLIIWRVINIIRISTRESVWIRNYFPHQVVLCAMQWVGNSTTFQVEIRKCEALEYAICITYHTFSS